MKSITGLEINNPNICIKGNGQFACICAPCLKEGLHLVKAFGDKYFPDSKASPATEEPNQTPNPTL